VNVHSDGDYGIAAAKSTDKIKSNASNYMYSNYVDYHNMVDILVNAERPLV